MNQPLAQDQELLREYLAECEELLQRIDEDLVALESDPGNAEVLNRVFRAFHTIKGTSGFMGLSQIVELTHHAEDILNVLRKGQHRIEGETMDALLEAHDQLRKMVDDVRNNNLREYALAPLLAKLRAVQTDLEETHDNGPRLGEIMMVEQVITRSELNESLAQAVWEGKKLGEVLVENKLASPGQVSEALAKQQEEVQPAPAVAKADVARTLRVDVAKLDELLNLVGELVLERNRLARLTSDVQYGLLPQEKFLEALGGSTSRLSSITEELQSASLKTRMIPVDICFRRFPRLVRDIARKMGKEVELTITGEDTEIDKTVVELIGDPLVHLIRNAMDHGIEKPETREGQGKPRQGSIHLEAHQEGDNIVVSVADDGAGIDPEVIGRKAVEKGLRTAEQVRAMGRRELLELIFLPGFSTAEQVSDISGRGVGMDVVRTNLERLNGIIELDSQAGQGTCVRLKLPLTLAILPVLLVQVSTPQGFETYAIPLRSVLEIVRIPAAEIHRLGDHEIFRLRDRVMPLLRLRKIFRLGPVPSTDGFVTVVVLGAGEKRVGLAVDQLLGQEETVVKPLGAYMGKVEGFAGATISGDGQVRLILDPASVIGAGEDLQAA